MFRREEIVGFIVALAGAALMFSLPGCAGVKSQSEGETTVRTPDGFVYTHSSSGKSVTNAPSDASTPSTAYTDANGAGGEAAGTHQKTAEQIIAENQSKIFFGAAVFLVLCALAAVFFRQFMLAATCGAAAIGLAIMPSIAANPVVQIGVPAGLVAIGVVWWIARKHGAKQAVETEREATVAKSVQLKNEGKTEAALEVISTAPTFRKLDPKAPHPA